MAQIIGYRKFLSKAKKPCCIVVAVAPVTPRDQDFGAVGSKVVEEFVPVSQHDLFVPEVVGKEIEFTYSVDGGKAYVDAVSIS